MDSVTIDNQPSPMAALLHNPAIRQLLAMGSIAASMALGVFIIFAMRTPDYNRLYADLDERESAAIMAALEANEIPYKTSASGQVTVPADLVGHTRLILAGEGLPSESGGVDILAEDPGFGVSQFIETKRYNHALENELARTISSLEPVRSARVHLAMAKDSVFLRNRGKTSASVLLDVVSSNRLEREHVSAIVYLVARSINGLEAEQVTVVDQTGRMLNSPDSDSEFAMSAKQFEHTQRVENTYVQRIEDLLTPIVGVGGVNAKVDADLDFTVNEQTQELFDPDNTALRSENTRFNERRGGEGAQGVPGALSNQPPVSGNPGTTTDPENNVPPVNTSQEAVRNYEVDRTISRTVQATGEIRRLSVAVVIDNRYEQDAEGNTVSMPREQTELDNIRALVREAVGFNAARGDSISLVNSSFQNFASDQALEPPKLWETPMFRDLLKQGVGTLLVLIVIFGLLRPMSRGLMQAASAPQLGNAQMTALPGGAGQHAVQGGDAVAELSAPVAVPVEQRIDSARKLAGDDPERVAQVVKNWVAEDG